jgi:hypothetical protein
MAVENVKNLHTALIDTRAANELALKDTEDADVARYLPRDDLAPPLRSSRPASIANSKPERCLTKAVRS